MISKLSRFLLFLCIIYSQVVPAQGQNRIDSLIHILGITNESKAKARLLLRISKEEELRDPGKSLKYAQQARQVSQRADYDSAEVRALILIGANYTRMMLLKEAIEIGEQIVEKASNYNMQLEIAEGRGIMAVAYAQGGDYDNSSKLYFENLKFYEKLNKKNLLGRTLGNIGADFIDQQSYGKALEYTNKALIYGLETNNLPLVTDQYNNLAAIYQIGFNDFTKALRYYFEALKVAKKIKDYQQQGTILINIGRIYFENTKFDTAYYYFDLSLSLFKEVNNEILMADSYIELGNYYFQKGEYSKAKRFALTSLEIGEKNKQLLTVFYSADLLNKIYLSESDITGAYKYLVIRTNTNNSLRALQTEKQLYKLEFQYNQEKKDKEQRIRQQKHYFIFGFILLILLSGLAITILFISRQRIRINLNALKNEKLESTIKFKNKELSINLMALLKKNELITDLSQKLANLLQSSSKIDLKVSVTKILHDIEQSSDDKILQEFTVRFNETNSQFNDKLLKQFPTLTQSELKLSAYLRLNMTTKDISELTGQRAESIDVARYRLRKKLGISNSDSNLVAFLSKI